MGKLIKVQIERDEKIELIFNFETEIILDLSSDKIEDTQCFFLSLLKEVIKINTIIEFKLDDEKEDLYHDIAKKYLSNLQNEIKKIVSEIPKQLHDNDVEF